MDANNYVDFEAVIRVMKLVHGLNATKIAEISGGVINRILRATLDNGDTVVVKLSSTQYSRKTEYEVSALKFAKELELTVPTVLGYDLTRNNDLGREHIIMTEMPGVPIARMAEKLSTDDLRQIMSDVTRICEPMWRQRFDAIGQLDSERKPAPFSDGSHGPYKTCVDYCVGDLVFRLDQLERAEETEFLGSTARCKENISKWLTAEDDVFLMTHCDLNYENILISKNTYKVTGVVDWEWCQAGPIEVEITSSDFYEKPELKDDFVDLVSDATGIDVAEGLTRKEPILSAIGGLMSLDAHKRWAARLGWTDVETSAFEENIRRELRSSDLLCM